MSLKDCFSYEVFFFKLIDFNTKRRTTTAETPQVQAVGAEATTEKRMLWERPGGAYGEDTCRFGILAQHPTSGDNDSEQQADRRGSFAEVEMACVNQSACSAKARMRLPLDHSHRQHTELVHIPLSGHPSAQYVASERRQVLRRPESAEDLDAGDGRRHPHLRPRHFAQHGSSARLARASSTFAYAFSIALLLAAALSAADSARVLPANYSTNVTFFLANTTAIVRWSSEIVYIPNFVKLTGSDDGFEYSILHLTGSLPTAFSKAPSIGADLSLTLSFADNRLGGVFSFSVLVSYIRALTPSNTTHSSAFQPAGTTTIDIANMAFELTVLSSYAKLHFNIFCPSGDAACNYDAVLPMALSKTALLFSVDVSAVHVQATTSLHRLGAQTSLQVNVEVLGANVASLLSTTSAISDSTSFSTADLSAAMGMNTTLVYSGVYFTDAAAAAGADYLRLAQDKWAIQSCTTCGQTYSLSNLVVQITATNLAAGADGSPVYELRADYLRHRISAADGYGPWLTNAPWSAPDGSVQAVTASFVNKVLYFNVQNDTAGEVEFRIVAADRSTAAVLRVNVAPTNSAPSYSLILPASTVVDSSEGAANVISATNPASSQSPAPVGGDRVFQPQSFPDRGGVGQVGARRLLSKSTNRTLAVYENSAPIMINLTNIERGGWSGTSSLPLTLSFSQEPLPLVAEIIFDKKCYTSSACNARVVLHPRRHGVTRISIAIKNEGGQFTPFGADNSTVIWELTVAKVNAKPSFVRATAALNVDEDSSCTVLPTAGVRLEKFICTQGSPLLHVYPNFLTSIYAGLYEDKSALGCPSVDPFTAYPGACMNQNISFTLTWAAGQPSSVGSIFVEAPTLSTNGTLRFRLAPNQVGEVIMNATIVDDGSAPQSSSDLFTIFVLSINDPPSFALVPEVVVYEGSSTWSGVVVDNITAGCAACSDENDNYCDRATSANPGTSCQTVFMDVVYSVSFPNLFTAQGQPRLERTSIRQGTLTFEIAPDQFGVAYLDVMLYDSGGRNRGGVDTSPVRRLTIRTIPVNDPPAFELTTMVVTVEENSGDLVPMQIARDITAGKSNEDCAREAESAWCEGQRVTFIIEFIQGAELFSRLPAIDAAGILTFRVYPGATGASRVYTRLEDDGVVAKGSRGNVSKTKHFAVVITPVESQANFSLGRNVACLRISDIAPGQCTCPPPTMGQKTAGVCAGVLQPGEVSKIKIIERSGPQLIEAFVTDITNAAGYQPGSLSVFTRNETTGLLVFQEQRAHEYTGQYPMTYATDFRVSSDSRHLYAVEAETDSVSIFDLRPLEQGVNTLERRFRIQDSQRHLVLRGFNATNAYDRTPSTVATQSLSSLALFVHDKQAFVLAAQGAEPVENDVMRRREQAKEVAVSKYQNLNTSARLWGYTSAFWMFDFDSVFAPAGMSESDLQARFNVDPADFTGKGEHRRESEVRCGSNGCSFARHVAPIDHDWCPQSKNAVCGCNERFPTSVQYASVRDLTGRIGPVLLTGPQCKKLSKCTSGTATEHCKTRGRLDWSETGNDWDAVSNQTDLRSFIVSNGDVEAMQFDDNLNTGLFLAFDMKKVAPLMPQTKLSVEVWFTIDADAEIDNREHTADDPQSIQDLNDFPVRRALVGVESFIDVNDPLPQFCSQGWSLSYSHQKSKSTLRFHMGLDGSVLGDKPLEFEVKPRIEQGVWQHLVATYDGAEYINIYLNGDRVAEKIACKEAPCGAIHYPGLVARGDCTLRPANFSIGGWKNGEDKLKDFVEFKDPAANSDYLSMGKHHGAIHMVRVYETALTLSEVHDQFDMLKYKMGNNSLRNPVRSWAVKEEQTSNSPSIDFAHSAAPQLVVVHGFFDVFARHRCEWHALPPQAGDEEEVSYASANTTESSPEGYTGNTLSCFSALWKFGPRVTQFYISSLGDDGKWKRLWMKVCLVAECGYLSKPLCPPGGAACFQPYSSAMYFATPDDTGRYTLRSTAHAVPRLFRFVQSSSIYLINMTAPPTTGPVGSLELVGTSMNLLSGTIRIFSDNPSTSGRLFKARFRADANGTNGSIFLLEAGVGYSKDGGNATLCHPESFSPMADSVTGGVIVSGGEAYNSGTWEIVSGSYSGSVNVSCRVSPKGTFKATVLELSEIGTAGVGGVISSISIEFHGAGCTTEMLEESVVFYHKGSRNLQENSITRVVGLSNDIRGDLKNKGPQGTPIASDAVPQGLPYIDAVAVCPPNTVLGVNCSGSGFVGRCILVYESGTPQPQVIGFTIQNHGSGYRSGNPPEILCAYAGTEFAISESVFPMIPNRARVKFTVARGGVVRYSAASHNGILLVSEPGLSGGQWSGIWGNSTDESVRPLLPASIKLVPLQFDIARTEMVTVEENETILVNQTVWATSGVMPGPNGINGTNSSSIQQVSVTSTKMVNRTLLSFSTATFVLAVNHWDGVTGNRQLLTTQGLQLVEHEVSYLMLWHAASGDLKCVQAINTSGAVSFHHFNLLDADYIVAANYREVFPDGSTSTVARSAIYRIGAKNPAVNQSDSYSSSAPRLGAMKCTTDTPIGRSPVWTSDATRFTTAGAMEIDTFIMNHSTRFGQIMYMVVANYYNSDTSVSSGISKLYMMGKPHDDARSRFGVNTSHLWARCSDSQQVCGYDTACHIHKCDQGCVVTRRQGRAPEIKCTCSNRMSQTCSADAECNAGITCTPQHLPVPLEDHTHCIQDGSVYFEGGNREGQVVLCEIQSFDVETAHSVVHWQSATVHVIVFASESAASKVFVTNDGAKPFLELQSLPTRRATQLQFVQPNMLDRPFLLIAQDTQAFLYKWNGTWLELQQSVPEPNDDAMVACAFVDGSSSPFAAFGGGNERFQNTISVLQGFEEVLPVLDAPGAIELSPDGQHVYVVSERSRGIFQYLRDSVTGEIQLLDSLVFPYVDGVSEIPPSATPWGAGVTTDVPEDGPVPPANQYAPLRDGPAAGNYGYPTRGLVSIVMAPDGRYFYAASFYDNAVHIWSRDTRTGKLTWQSTFSDPGGDEDMRRGRTGLGPGGYFLRGPRSMTLGQLGEGTVMLLACSTSKSVVLLSRNVTTGALTFVDAARDGERDISTFITSVPAPTPSAHPFPTRIGGSSGAGRTRQQQEETWARTAQIVRPFLLKGRQMLALGAFDNSRSAAGAAVIMEWKPRSGGAGDKFGKFETVQVLDADGSAVDIVYFEIETQESGVNEFLVVANAYGSTNVYLWDGNGFYLHHSLPMARLTYDSAGCSCLCKSAEEIALHSNNRTDFICGTCFKDAVMRQSQDTCSEPRPMTRRDCAVQPLALLPRAVKHFFVRESRQHFLAVAYWSADNKDVLSRNGINLPDHEIPDCLRVYSHIYRWNEDTPRRLDNGRVVWGNGFEPFFPIATSGAIGVEHVTVAHAIHGIVDLVGVAEFAGANADETRVRMFRFVRYAYNPFLKTSAGSFSEYQLLPVTAAYHLHAFNIDDEGTFLAVAARQKASAPEVSWRSGAGRAQYLSNYDMSSALLKWNGTLFNEYQILGGNVTAGDASFSSIAATPRAFDANSPSNSSNCTASPASLECQANGQTEGWAMGDGLRGATSMHSFKDVDGEMYLAVAQSVCEPTEPNAQCNHTAHPMSSILQWDRVHKRFSELLAYTDESHGKRFGGAPVRREEILVHQAALRISAGRVRQWSSIVVGGGDPGMGWPGVVEGGVVAGRMTLLIAASADEGALAYEFRFQEVVGLDGSAAATMSPLEDFVYVAAEDDNAISIFAAGQNYDITQRKVSHFRQLQVCIIRFGLRGRSRCTCGLPWNIFKTVVIAER